MDPNNPNNETQTNDDDYDESGYGGDPTEGGTRPAAVQNEELETGYGGDGNGTEIDNETDGEGAVAPAVSSTLNNFYSLIGLENGQVDIDGEVRDFATLSPEDQASVFNDKLDDVREQVRVQTIESFGLSQDELGIIDHYRATGSLAGLEAPASTSITSLTHDDLHRQAIRSLLGDTASEQDIEKSLETRRTSPTFTQEAEAIRRQLTSYAQANATQAEQVEYDNYTQAIKANVTTLNNVGGIPITPEHQQYVIDQLTKRTDGGLAPFIAMLGDEKQLAVIATKALFFDNTVAALLEMKGVQRTKTIDEILGVRGVNTTQGPAPTGTRRAAGGQNNGGHRLTNEDIDKLG